MIKLIVFCLLLSLKSNCQQNISLHQKKFDAHITKYRDSILQTNDTVEQREIFLRFWTKHMKYIQDTFKMGFPKIDTFEFKKVTVKSKIDKKRNQEQVVFYFDNEIYYAVAAIVIQNNPTIKSNFNLYKQAKKINKTEKVNAIIQFEGLSFYGYDYKTIINNIYLRFELKDIIIPKD